MYFIIIKIHIYLFALKQVSARTGGYDILNYYGTEAKAKKRLNEQGQKY